MEPSSFIVNLSAGGVQNDPKSPLMLDPNSHDPSPCAVTPPPSPPPSSDDMSSDGLSLDIVPRPNSLPSWVLATFREDAMGLLCQNAPIHEWDEADRWRVEAWYDCLSEDNVEAATNLAAQYPRAVTGSFFQGVGAIPTVCVACLLGSVKVVEVSWTETGVEGQDRSEERPESCEQGQQAPRFWGC